ncbi:MAG: hypothetical protein HYX36_17475 [Rhizobiales bacterium]|nr:hypothetical protein [Hyphomicrobiales bacterium]
MTSSEFIDYLRFLGLEQMDAAAMLRVTPRTVRRWQKGDLPVPDTVSDLLRAWRQLAEANIPWAPDLESILQGDSDQIRRHQDHALSLAAVRRRVEARRGPAAPWRISLKEHRATLGPMTVQFYHLANGGFSLASYWRRDKDPDPSRDQHLIEDAVVSFSEAVGEARRRKPNKAWDE